MSTQDFYEGIEFGLVVGRQYENLNILLLGLEHKCVTNGLKERRKQVRELTCTHDHHFQMLEEAIREKSKFLPEMFDNMKILKRDFMQLNKLVSSETQNSQQQQQQQQQHVFKSRARV